MDEDVADDEDELVLDEDDDVEEDDDGTTFGENVIPALLAELQFIRSAG